MTHTETSCSPASYGRLEVAMFRRSTLENLGGFNEMLRVAADLELYLRVARDGILIYHGEIVLEYRCHAGNMTRNREACFSAAVKVLNAERHA
jgi:hypothetical protein